MMSLGRECDTRPLGPVQSYGTRQVESWRRSVDRRCGKDHQSSLEGREQVSV